MHLSLARIVRVSVSLIFMMAFASAAGAQNQSAAAPHTPDLLGIYPGMPLAAARAQLQLHSKTDRVITNNDPESGFGMMNAGPNHREQISVFLTRPPDDPAVWMIQRSENFDTQNVMSQEALITALRGKYGKETFNQDHGGGGLYLFWIFDQNGKLLPATDPGLTGCTGGMFINYSWMGPPQTATGIEQTCFHGFFAVTAMLNRHDAQLLQAYTVELVNMPFAFRAATDTGNAKNAAANRARQSTVDKANQNKPSF